MYIDFYSPVTISEGSTVVVEGSRLQLQNVSGDFIQLFAIYANEAPLTVANGSNLNISNTWIEIVSVSVSSGVQAFTLYADQYSPLTVSNSSTLTVGNSNITIVEGYSVFPTFGTLYLAYSSSLNVFLNSSVFVQRTVFVLINGVSPQGDWSVNVLSAAGPSSSLSVAVGSRAAFSDTIVVVRNVTTKGTWAFCVVRMGQNSEVSVFDNSTFSITNTAASLTNMSIGADGYWWWMAFFTVSPTNISDKSGFSIDNTHVTAAGVNVSMWEWRLSLIWSATPSDAPIWVDRSSALSISKSEFGAQDCFVYNLQTSSDVSCILFDARSPLLIEGNLSISDSNIEITSKVLAARILNIASSIIGSGDVFVENATIMNENGEIVSVSPMLNETAPTFYVCGNDVGGAACVVVNNNFYACGVNISHRVSSCSSGKISHTVERTPTLLPPAPVTVNMTVRTTISSPTELVSALRNVTVVATTIVFTNETHPCTPIPPSEADPGTVNETLCAIAVTPKSSAAEIKDAIAEGRIPGVYAGASSNPPSPAPKKNQTPLIVGVVVGCVALVFAVGGVILYVRKSKRLPDESAGLFSVSG